MNSNGLQPTSNGLQPTSDGLHLIGMASDLIAMASNLEGTIWSHGTDLIIACPTLLVKDLKTVAEELVGKGRRHYPDVSHCVLATIDVDSVQ